MDKEEREALEMTKEDLLAAAENGKSAKVARKKPARVRGDLNQRAAAIVDQATQEVEDVYLTFPKPMKLRTLTPQELADMRTVKGQVSAS
jgi:hypothetical protein